MQSTMVAWVKAVTRMPCRLENKPTALALKLPAEIILQFPGMLTSMGTDYVQWSDGADPGMLQPTVVGHREFDVAIRVVSRSQAGNKSAQYWLEKLRAALSYPSTLDTFSEAGLAIVRMGAGAQFDAPFEERWESVAAATLRMACVIADADDVQVSTLTSVGLTTTIEGEDGQVLPTPPNLVDELITVE